MTVGLDQALDTPPATAAAGRTGLRAILVDIFIRPRAAMRNVADRHGKVWIWPLVVLALLASVTAAVQARSTFQQTMANVTIVEDGAEGPGGSTMSVQGDSIATDAQTAQAMQSFSMIGVILRAVFVLVAVVLGVALVAAILHFLGTVFGGQQGYGEMLIVTSWAQVPVILGLAVRLVGGLAWGFDPNPDGLSGLVGPTSFLHPLLGQIELWHLWGLALLFVGLRVVARITRAKAVAAIAVVIALQLLLGEVGVMVTRFTSPGL